MEILEVNQNQFREEIKDPYFIYGSAEFNELNKDKCKEIFYLLFRDSKYRLGISGGVRDNCFHSPFSAPFGGFIMISGDIRIKYLEEAIELFLDWILKKKLSSIKIVLPPSIYGTSFISKQINCLWRAGFFLSSVDLNFSFDLENLDEKYQENIWYNARKNLKISLKSGFNFLLCISADEKCLAYDIIRKNRESRGFPLRMTFQQVFETIKIIEADFFIVEASMKNPVAAAIVFHVSQSVVQVVYWGDLDGYSELKPMNYLSYKVFEFYKFKGKTIVDIGPSTENSIPNHGLCEFKESIGCSISPKFTFIK